MLHSRVLPLTRRSALTIGAGAVASAAAGSIAFAQPTPEILAAWAAGWSDVGNPDKLLAISAPDIVYEDVAIGRVFRGIDQFRTLLDEAAGAIPDFRIELFDGFATDTMAAAEYAITGTQTGDLPYLATTGKPFRVRAASVFVLAGGKIARESRYYDALRFLEELGGLEAAMPKLGTAAAKPGG